MLQKPKECDKCILSNYLGGFSQPEGNCKNGVLIIGEALGENEKQDGLPFRPYAESGSALQTCIRNLKKFGINQERLDFGFWNLVACQPPRNALAGARYEEDAILTCRENYFDKVVEFYKPKVILALGNLTLKYLVPEISSLQESLKEKLKEFKGDKDKEKRIKAQLSKLTISALRGYKFNSIYNIPLIPSFHPSFITRGERVLLGVLLRDLMFALEIAGGEIAPYKFENYIEYPSELDLQDFIRTCYYNSNSPISYDIETSFTPLVVDETEIEFGKEVREIESVQFSIPISDNGKVVTKSIFLDWEKDIDYIKSILKLSNSKVGWNNWQFDETNLKYHLGEDAINGIRYDSMWLFKHLNADFKKTGRALQFAANFYIPNLPAWKHISESEPRKYGLIDVDATLKTFLGLRKDMEASKLDAPKTKNLFEGYVDDIVKLYPILQKMSQRGIPINIPERTKFDEELAIKQAKVLDELQEVYPTELRRPDPILGYKNIPKEVLELAEIFSNKYLDYDSPNYVVFISNKEKDLALSRFIEINSRRKPEDYEERKSKKDVIGQTGLVVKEFIVDGQRTKRYCRLDRFKPNSKDQILAYVKHKGYKIKKKRVGKEEKESTEKDAMFDLYEQTKDDFFLKVGLYKEFAKIRRTYIHGWKTDSEGRVHSTFLPLPATGQLSSINPNVQNAPGHGSRYNSKDYVEMALRFRNCIEAREGYTLIERDYSGFHAIMLGVEAEDATYVRLAKLGVHDFLTAHMVRNEYASKKRFIDITKLKSSTKELNDLRNRTLEWIEDLDNWLSLNDKELSIKLQWIKKNHKLIRDAQAKPAVHGMGFGMGANKFFKLNKHAFSTIEEPKRILNLMRSLFPKIYHPITGWQEAVKLEAHEKTYLLSRYGYIRRFWDVYDFRLLTEFRPPKSEYEKIFTTKDGKIWLRTDGQQIKEAVAFRPANNAFGKKKEAMRDMEERGLLDRYRLILDNHDSLLFECQNSLIEDCLRDTKYYMELPTRHISTSNFPSGISCPTEVKIGKKWGSLEKVKE